MSERLVPRLEFQYPAWQPDCLAAIHETDPKLMKEKIAAAELAMFTRAAQLDAGEDGEAERQAMKEAAHSLRKLLVTILNYPDS